METIIVCLAGLVVFTAIVAAVNYFLLKSKEEMLKKPFILSISLLLVLYSGLFVSFQYVWGKRLETQLKEQEAEYTTQMTKLQEEQAQAIEILKKDYTKEIALLEWKNRIFVNNADMKKALEKVREEHELSADEVRSWQALAENNTLDKLMPKSNTNDVLKEYQGRLKNSLASVRSGHTLMNAEIRMLSDNINTIRVIGKEYEKTLGVFRELYDNIIASNASGTVMERPKQKKVLFFPVKQKEYEDLLEQYYQSQGNQTATAEVAVKLKKTIDQAEAEFKAINRKFEANLGFLESNAEGITYNADKLENLIEAAISQANVVNETNKAQSTPPKVINKQTKKQ